MAPGDKWPGAFFFACIPGIVWYNTGMKETFMVWEWGTAPEWVRLMSPAYDDVDFVAVLPEGHNGVDVPWWLENINGYGGANNVWKRVNAKNELFPGRIVLAICHS